MGKLTAVLLSVLMVFTYSFGYLGTTFAGTDPDKIYKDSNTGLTYLLNAEDHTAELNAIDDKNSNTVNLDVPARITVPEGHANAGEYDVTAISLSRSDHSNVKSITMHEPLKTVRNIHLLNVKEISFPASVETIDGVYIGKWWGWKEEGADTGSVTFQGNSLTTLHDVTFNNTKTLDLPDSVTSISGVINIKYVENLTIPGKVNTVDFQLYCDSLKNLTFGEGITAITKNNLFAKAPELETIVLPDSLESISGSWTFKGLTSLKNINIPSKTKLAKDDIGTFCGCSSLESIELPDGFLQDGKVPDSMFEGCSSLKSVKLGSTVTKVGKYAFSGCSSLSEISSIENLTEVGKYAFDGCSSLKDIGETDKLEKIGEAAFRGTSSLWKENDITVDLSKVDSIPNYAFSGSGIKHVRFSKGLTSIGGSAFYGSGLKDAYLPDSLINIGKDAFCCCGNLTTVTIGKGVTKLTNGEFKECPKLDSVEIGPGIKAVKTAAFDGCKLGSMIIHSAREKVAFDKDAEGNYKDVGGLPYEKIRFEEEEAEENQNGKITVDGTKTLQEAVDEAAKTGETVVLEKNVYLKDTLTVPGGDGAKKVLIKSADGGNYFIRQALKKAKLPDGKLIEVKGHLALENVDIFGGDVSINRNSGLIDVDAGGTLDIGDGTVVENTQLTNNNSAVIRAAGTVNMNGGSIKGNYRLVDAVDSRYIQHTATVLLTSGAEFNMSGGSISENNSAEGVDPVVESEDEYNARANSAHLCTPGVMLCGGSTMNMSGGEISGNKGNCGSAIYAQNGIVTISDGASIYNNKTFNIGETRKSDDGTVTWDFAPGAVYISGSSKLTMNGGALYMNTGAATGGAIAVDSGGTFDMNGGEIYGNRAGKGGGIYTYSDNTNINKGKIYNNTADLLGGGVYAEGNNKEPDRYAVAKFAKTAVYDNHATKLGGGYWGCPTASFVSEGDGCAVFDNETTDRTADAAGDDYALNNSKSVPIQINGTNTISDRAPGGGKMTFAKDGGVNANNTFGYSNHSARYDTSSQTFDTVQNDKEHSHALKTLIDDQAKELAKEKAPVQIYGNSAEYGGGIGANGGVHFGGSSSRKILVTKKWEGNEKPSVDSVQVEIYADGKRIETVTLTSGDGWKKLIEGLPEDIGTITAKEVPIDGYNSSVEVAADKDDTTLINVTVTNSKKPENPPETEKTQVSVKKVWENDTADDRPDSVSVQLLRNGTAYGGTVSLSEDNNWSYTWTDLDASYDWSVEEVSVPDGYNSVTSHDGNSWTITNTKTKPEEPDSENPRPVTPDEPDEPTKPSGDNGRTITKKTVRKTEVRTPAGRFVRTGDTNDVLIYAGIFAAAAAGAVYVSIRRSKKTSEK